MSVPQIFFESGFLLDLEYDFKNPNNPIAEKSKPRVQELMQIFDQIWRKEGSQFLLSTVQEIGLPFRRKELSCTITISPDQYSCSHPLIVNAARFYSLAYFTQTDQLRFVDTLFHELLHRYLDDHFVNVLDISSESPSPLMAKFKNEDIFTHAHMHLYALQKVIFERLGLTQEWKQVSVWVDDIPEKGYKRALEIVESVGAQFFVDELKALVR